MKVDISCVLTFHAEGLIADATIRGLERSARHARSRGLTVEPVIALDRASSETRRCVESSSLLPPNSQVFAADFGDLGLARNAAVQRAGGAFVAICDGDDLISENWLFRAHELGSCDERFIVHPERNVHFDQRRTIFRHTDQQEAGFDVSALLLDNCWTSLAFSRRETFLAVPYCAASPQSGFGYEDWHWNCETIARGFIHKVAPETAHFLRAKGSGSLSQQAAERNAVMRHSALFEKLGAKPAGGSGCLRHRITPSDFVPSRLLGLRTWLARRLRGAPKLPDWLTSEMREIAEIEPKLLPSREFLEHIVEFNPFRATDAGEAYAELLAELGPDALTRVILLPEDWSGESDQATSEIIRAAAGAAGINVAVISTGIAGSPRFEGFPAIVKVVHFGRATARLSESDAKLLLTRLLLQLRPAFVHDADSGIGGKIFRCYGTALESASKLSVSISDGRGKPREGSRRSIAEMGKWLLINGMHLGFSTLRALARETYKRAPVMRPLLNELKIARSRLSFGGVDYRNWIVRCDRLGDADRDAIREHIKRFPRAPLISVVVPVHDAPEVWLRRCLESVFSQLYPNWELCIADDASTVPHVRKVLEEFRSRDRRVKVVYRTECGHISAASNAALSLVEGEFVALLDHDDELSEHALYLAAAEIVENPQARLLFSDEDKIDPKGRRFSPYFKGGYSYDLLLSQNMISHLGIYQTELIKRIGGFRAGFEGSQDWDMALRCVEFLKPEEIRHIPYVLYHWRAVPTSTALGAGEKSYAVHAGRRAVSEHLERSHFAAAVEPAPGLPDYNRVRPILSRESRASLVIAATGAMSDLRRCVESLKRTGYANYEVLIVDNGSSDRATLEYLQKLERGGHAKILRHPRTSNAARLTNFGVSHAEGDVVVILDESSEVIAPDWLAELVGHACRPDVGAVGARLLDTDGTLQHAGIILGLGGIARDAFKSLSRRGVGYLGQALLTRDVSAVGVGCLAARTSVYREAGGLDEKNTPENFRGVDFCLRLRERGLLIVYTPYAELYQHKPKTEEELSGRGVRLSDRETAYMKSRWGDLIENDPYYSPNLTLENDDFSLASSPRVRKPWLVGELSTTL